MKACLRHSGRFSASQSPCVRRATQECRCGRASLVDFALTLGSLHRVGESDKSAAAVRSTGLRLLHFSNPEGFRDYQPCRYFALSLQQCNDQPRQILIIFLASVAFASRPIQRKKAAALQKSPGSQISALRLLGVRRSRS